MTRASGLLTDPIFGDPTIRAHFDDQAIMQAMVRVEAALACVQAELGVLPEAAARAISALPGRAEIQSTELVAGVANNGVPVPALVEALRAQLAPEAADWLHYGVTSQDVVDTALCLCYGAAVHDLEASLGAVIDALERQSRAHSETLMLARTRGQLATPITFGLRVAQWAQPLIALESELGPLRQTALRVQLGGASGSRNVFGDVGPQVAKRLAKALNLSDSAPWHSDRSGIGRMASWLARLITATAKIGTDVALLARGEIAELRPAAGGSSSTMPHKSNPVKAEALQSLAPIAVACEAGLTASSTHAEERDGAPWSVEWTLMPTIFEAAGAALAHAETLVGGLQVNTAAMRARIDSTPEVKAEAAVFALAPGRGRIEASRIVADILASGRPLVEALSEHADIDWGKVLADEAYTRPAAETATQIFASRNADRGDG